MLVDFTFKWPRFLRLCGAALLPLSLLLATTVYIQGEVIQEQRNELWRVIKAFSEFVKLPPAEGTM